VTSATSTHAAFIYVNNTQAPKLRLYSFFIRTVMMLSRCTLGLNPKHSP